MQFSSSQVQTDDIQSEQPSRDPKCFQTRNESTRVQNSFGNHEKLDTGKDQIWTNWNGQWKEVTSYTLWP